jgi:hypothetical protein
MTKHSGFASMGKPVPGQRRQAAYDAAKSMGVENPLGLVEGMAHLLERDKPFEAMEFAALHVDLTGAYRMMATLLTGEYRDAGALR